MARTRKGRRTPVVRIPATRRDRYADFRSSLPVGVVVLDSEGQIIDLNPAGERLLGFGPGSAQMARFEEIVDPDARDAWRQWFATIANGKTPPGLELELRRADGSGASIRLDCHAALPGGPGGGRLVILTDVSARRAAEAALAGSEERFHRLLQEVPTVAVQGYSMDGTARYWNRASAELYGYTEREALGRNLLHLIIPEPMRPAVQAAMRRMAETGITPPTGELSLMRKDGSRIDVISSHTLVHVPGREPELFCIDVDITDRRRVEEELQASEEGYRQLLRHSPEAILIHRNDIIEFANEAAVALFRADPPGALVGLDWHRLIAPEFQPTAEKRCASVLDGEVSNLPWREMRYLSLDRAPIQAESTSALVRFNGRPALMTTVRDISTRKKIEEELLAYRLELEDLVEQRTAELTVALQAAQQADQAKDSFLANVSHELRTPLSAILGLSELALKQVESPRQRDFLEKIGKAGKHLARVINDLLDLSKIVAGRLQFEAVAFDLRRMAGHCGDVMMHKAEEKGLMLAVTVADDLPAVLIGDPLRVQQVLLNLVGNAIKFTDAGGVDVRIGVGALEERRVRLLVEVEDTGIGMRADELDRLFQPFTQSDASMSRRFGGTGLGLAISRQLAELMGGTIEARSAEGSGTTFVASFWLGIGAADDIAPDDAHAAQSAVAIHYRDARVLVVEDHPMNREIAGELLRAVGITPHMATNGREALDILADSAPTAFDLILMDIQMPVLDGLGATREIRVRPGLGDIPIIAMTAHAMEHEKQTTLAAGMDDHLSKPFETERFYRILAKWIPAGKQTEAAAGAAPPPIEMPAGDDFNTRDALTRFGGSEERYRHWLATFAEEAPALAGEIRRAVAAGKPQDAASIAHGLKGRAGMLGLNALQASAGALETALKESAPTDELLERLERAIASAGDRIKARLDA